MTLLPKFRLQGLWVEIAMVVSMGLWFRDQGSGFRVENLRILGLGFKKGTLLA